MGWKVLSDGGFSFSGNLHQLMSQIASNYGEDVKKPLFGQRRVDLNGYTLFVALGLQDLLQQMLDSSDPDARRFLDDLAACHNTLSDGSVTIGVYPMLDLMCETLKMDELLGWISNSEFRRQVLENGTRLFGDGRP
jgi:hypothetical protein